ncbi:DNA-3-methyladenine glycosylase [Catalinimonas alkaloidigena]|uniref:DNA-3-methyladenine glycosylase n=1 Tax=Catalinimonas alkaloidigena TaxID=1075417 RepID=UPI002406113B|nr:DNA-3-methyladenine glycosylase [Catalinimonas alkaloidigena]MDF9797363.1 DNA-3-methyladenine glycosylase [Catalinimonas alkaloidigena]
MNIIPKAFYLQDDVVSLSRQFLGKYLFTKVNGHISGGKIVETEAYSHINDKACHSHMKKRTPRTEIMFHEGGVAYIYKIYGMYDLFNIITNKEGKADAVLVRAIEPTDGIELMQHRRNLHDFSVRLTAGPGMLSQALGISKAMYGAELTKAEQIWIEDRQTNVSEGDIIASPRVGIDYAGDDALLPWRFRVKGNRWTSKAK